jgi:glycosyltransferase involved in cell wall biosynthesis
MTDLAVIMSIYKNDRLEFVRQSVQSILDQTFTDFHYYLIFDGPVAADVELYITSLTDERIRFFRLESNNGLAAALNFLLEIVMKNPEYKFIARMDADDISMPERFEKQRDCLIEKPEITVLGCWSEEIDEFGNHLAFLKLPADHKSLTRRYFTRSPFVHPSVMFNRKLVEIAGKYPTDTYLMEDNVLWGRALKAGLLFSNIQGCLLKYRLDKNFFNRKSGFRYGSEYIFTRLKIANTCNFGPFFQAISILIGLAKMLPASILRPIYQVTR